MKTTKILTVTLSSLALLAMTPASAALAADDSASPAATSGSENQEVVKIDASSRSAFKASLDKMRASLSTNDRLRLNTAFSKLLAPGTEPAAGGKAEMKEGAATGSYTSFDDRLYEKVGAELDGKTFEDIIKQAG